MRFPAAIVLTLALLAPPAAAAFDVVWELHAAGTLEDPFFTAGLQPVSFGTWYNFMEIEIRCSNAVGSVHYIPSGLPNPLPPPAVHAAGCAGEPLFSDGVGASTSGRAQVAWDFVVVGTLDVWIRGSHT